MISIIIPIYNQADKLSSCLNSILKQSILTSPQPLQSGGQASPSQGEEALEVIIVNDGSTDNVEDVIVNYKTKFVNLQIINQENKGANSARNRGARVAKGEYLLFCDADIEMETDMLKIMLKTFNNNPGVSFAYSSFKYGQKTFKLGPYDAEKLKKMPYIHTSSLIRHKHFPGWDESIKRFQDWDLWLTMLKQEHTGVWIDKILFKVKPGGTMSSWLPSFAYKYFPFLTKVKKYNNALKIIKEKHNL